MIQTEIVKEIVRLQATTAYTGELKKNKVRNNLLNKLLNNAKIFFRQIVEGKLLIFWNEIILHFFSYNTEIKTAEEIQQFLSSKKTEKPMQTSGSSASNSNQTTDVFGFISTG